MPGYKFDKDKPRCDLLVPEAIEAEARVLGLGATTYGAENWKELRDAKERYTAAMFRHLLAYMRGERVDPQSGESHLAHIRCNAGFLYYFECVREDDGSNTS